MVKEPGRSDLFGTGTPPAPGDVLSVIEKASDIAVYLDRGLNVEGISVNPECPSLGCLDHWAGRSFNQFLTEESQEKLDRRLNAFRDQTDDLQRPIELNHVDNARWEFPVRYSIHEMEGGAFLLVGRDMQPIAEVQQRLLAEQHARERDLQALRGEETFFRIVLDGSETPLVLVDTEEGRIRDLNNSAAVLLGSKAQTLAGNAFAQVFEGRKRGEFMSALQAAAEADEAISIEATARRNGKTVQLYPESFRAAGKLYMLCRLELVVEKDDTAPLMSNALMSLFAATSDAIVLTDTKGDIREANEAFLIMADAAQLRDLRDTPLSNYLARGLVDLKLILEAVQKRDRLRSYSTQLVSAVGTRLSVEISATRLRNKAGEVGYGLIIRDVQPTEIDGTNGKSAAVSEDSMKNVMSLVGTAPLKHLVSATSDVVEKMCIETAVELTGNNRMAAAEMLGLSRQSLYTKLRKHGLHHGDGKEDELADEH